MRAVQCWKPILVEAKPAANAMLPVSRARGEVMVLVVGSYRKVVLAAAKRKRPASLRARGVFVTRQPAIPENRAAGLPS